jgi:hypothetical protein
VPFRGDDEEDICWTNGMKEEDKCLIKKFHTRMHKMERREIRKLEVESEFEGKRGGN